jgi:hypothetical protein
MERRRLSDSRAASVISNRPRFVVTFTAGRGTDNPSAIRALRAVLKNALKRHGLRAIDIREENAPAPDISNQIADAFTGLRRDVHDRLRGRSS